MDWMPLASRARLLFYLQAFARLLLFWVPLVVMGGIVGVFFVPLLWVVVGGTAFLFLQTLLAIWWPAMAFERWGWLLRDEDLLIRHGVLIHRVITVPTCRIQHVDTRQGPIEQWMGLARLQVYTASGVGSDGVIPGLDQEDAEAIRDSLLERVEGDDGV